MTVEQYVLNLPKGRKDVIKQLISIIRMYLPKRFHEQLNYGMPSWVVPHSIYPDGYHCSPELPLPFLGIYSRKNFIALYHMGIYADNTLMSWFINEYPIHCKYKLDMGKSCIRFKNLEDIPFQLIGELCTKMTVEEWVDIYEKNIKKQKSSKSG